MEAKKNYEATLIEFYNNRHNLEGYKEFVTRYKDHPAYNSVQDSIYAIATRNGSIAEYKSFITNYKSNRNVNDAWSKLYTLSTATATEITYRKFLDDNADFPNKEKVYKDIELSKLELKPIKQDDKYGYSIPAGADSGKVMIALQL